MLTLVVSDVGDVVLRWRGVMASFCTEYGLDRKEFGSWYVSHAAQPLYRGELSGKAFWAEVDRRYGIHVAGDPFSDHFRGDVILPVVNLWKELQRRGIRVVSASNTYDADWKSSMATGALGFFNAHYPSHILGLAKPDAAYYEAILSAEKADPGNVFFADDREENVKGAEAAGMHAYRYTASEDPEAVRLRAAVFSLLS